MRSSRVTVLYTRPEPTLVALRTARQLTWERGEPVRLVVIVPVPYPLPLSRPAVPLGFTEQEFRRFASQSPVATRVEVYLCRDHRDVLRAHLAPSSLVVLGARRRNWWGTSERRLTGWLQRHGHSVVLAAPDEEAGKRTLFHNVLQFRMPNSSH